MRCNLFFLLLALNTCFASSYAQKKISSLTVSDTVIYATVDRPGDLYIVTRHGQIQKFDNNGKLLSVYKSDPMPTLFDPRDGARLFAYFRGDQHYSFLNPGFEITASYQIDPSLAVTPWLVCVSGDHNLWIFDGADNSLKKINVSASTVDVEVRISDQYIDAPADITMMREYQGFLFLLNKKKGILVFSSMGNLLKTIGAPGLNYFNFIGEDLYYPVPDGLKLFNLFTAETREKVMKPAAFMLLTDERIFTIEDLQIDFFSVAR